VMAAIPTRTFFIIRRLRFARIVGSELNSGAASPQPSGAQQYRHTTGNVVSGKIHSCAE
jgi:hypothetical protein